jgi:hypothetical protein
MTDKNQDEQVQKQGDQTKDEGELTEEQLDKAAGGVDGGSTPGRQYIGETEKKL